MGKMQVSDGPHYFARRVRTREEQEIFLERTGVNADTESSYLLETFDGTVLAGGRLQLLDTSSYAIVKFAGLHDVDARVYLLATLVHRARALKVADLYVSVLHVDVPGVTALVRVGFEPVQADESVGTWKKQLK